MKTTGSRVGLGAAMRSLTQTESMSQRSQSSINSRTLSGDSLSNAPSPKAIPIRIFMVFYARWKFITAPFDKLKTNGKEIATFDNSDHPELVEGCILGG